LYIKCDSVHKLFFPKGGGEINRDVKVLLPPFPKRKPESRDREKTCGKSELGKPLSLLHFAKGRCFGEINGDVKGLQPPFPKVGGVCREPTFYVRCVKDVKDVIYFFILGMFYFSMKKLCVCKKRRECSGNKI